MLVAIYLRISTDMQETAAQQHAVFEHCKLLGYAKGDLQIFEDEGISGATLERPGFQQLLAAISTGEITKVVTFELSRLSRDFIAFLNILDLFQRKGVVVEVPGAGVQRFDTSTEKLVASIKAFSAANEREQIARRVKAGLAKAKANGVKLGAPMGNQRKKSKTMPVNSSVLSKVLQLRGKGLSIREIASVLSLSASKVQRLLIRASCYLK